ncbi:MAG: ISAzo13 family transposase, partial [Methylococcaceae bacterium]|nr:ISAzo13 family transposase [Methylococcaceae bacterium]
MSDDDIVEKIRKKYERLSGVLDERSRRVWASTEAEALGYGGQSIVAKATGLSRMTFYSQNLDSSNENNLAPPHTRIRKEGGGRKKLTQREPKLLSALEALVEPTTRGDPENPLRWTCLSTRQLAAALEKQGYRIGRQTVACLLDELGYSLQGNQKTKEGSGHPDRDAQFRYIH